MHGINVSLALILLSASIATTTGIRPESLSYTTGNLYLSSTVEWPASPTLQQVSAAAQRQDFKEACGTSDADGSSCGRSTATKRQKNCGPKHKKHSCASAECCSANGQCGRSEAFCGKHCQPEYGECWTKEAVKPIQNSHRCGKDFNGTRCGGGECCSAAGWCGKGTSYCFVPFNCQAEFGICDSDAVPDGPDLSPAAQPRPQVGNVPYGIEVRRCRKPGTIALSFDDGPSNNTVKILDVLRSNRAKATFFLSGNNNGKGMIDENTGWINIIKRIINEGHQIGSHTWSHPHLSAVSRDARLYDMIRNDRAITNIIGKFPTYMRPPYLDCSKESGCLQDMAELGYHVADWDVDSHDWELNQRPEQTKHTIAEAMKHRKPDGNMILIQHDHSQHVVEVTRFALEQAKEKNWQAVTIGQCMEDPPELWYHDPVWIQTGKGCVVSEPGFCGLLPSFKTVDECGLAHVACLYMADECEQKLGHGHPSCAKYNATCQHQGAFCAACADLHPSCTDRLDCPLSCDSRGWSFNRMTEASRDDWPRLIAKDE